MLAQQDRITSLLAQTRELAQPKIELVSPPKTAPSTINIRIVVAVVAVILWMMYG